VLGESTARCAEAGGGEPGAGSKLRASGNSAGAENRAGGAAKGVTEDRGRHYGIWAAEERRGRR